jgi:hypothetical protein
MWIRRHAVIIIANVHRIKTVFHFYDDDSGVFHIRNESAVVDYHLSGANDR